MNRRRPRSPSVAEEQSAAPKRAHNNLSPRTEVATATQAHRASVSARLSVDSTHAPVSAPIHTSLLHIELHVQPHVQVDPDSVPATPSPVADVARTPPSPEWCSCGACVEVEWKIGQSTPVCCMMVVADPVARSARDGTVCKSDRYTTVIDGLTPEQYGKWKNRIRSPPATFAGCNNPERRVVIYAELTGRLMESGGWQADDLKWTRRLKHKPMPVCLHKAVNEQWPDQIEDSQREA